MSGREFKTKVTQAVYDHYMTGSTRGDMYIYVKRGLAGLPYERTFTPNQRAAYYAGVDLAKAKGGDA